MEFRILGPIEVVGEDGPIALRRGKEQALLAYMLLHPNEVLPSERLIDQLWDERPPATASKILQNAVAQLRKALGDDRVETRAPGYVFRLDAGELDLDRFERLAAEGRNEEALALWRGSPLVDLREERFADDARRRLEERRLTVLEDRLEAESAAGRAGDPAVLAELDRLATEHPLRERVHALRMRALYAAGRQGDALAAYQQARRSLRDELGLEPGPELRELERRILAQDLPVGARPAERAHVRRRGRPLVGLLVAVLVVAGATIGAFAAFRGDAKTLLAVPNSVVAVDPTKNRVVAVAKVDAQPRAVAADDSSVWVANPVAGTVERLDPKSDRVVQTVGLGAGAIDMTIGAGDLWVSTGNDDTLVRLDVRNGAIKGTLRLPKDEVSAAAWSVASEGDDVWVTSGDRVMKVDPDSGGIALTNRCCSPFDIAVGFGSVWVVGLGTDVGVASGATARTLARVDVGLYTNSVATGFGSVWLTVEDNRGATATLIEIDPETHRVGPSIPIGPPRVRHRTTLPILAAAGSIWVADPESGDILRISPESGTVTGTVHVGGYPWALAFGNHRIWVAVA